MGLSNLEYLYSHLPARMRRDDEGLFLRRFLTYSGEQLDLWDEMLDTFYQKIDAATAPEQFIDWWLWSLFGWSWFPDWFRVEHKRALFADFAQHLARRGTSRGLEAWLRAFSIHARVYSRPEYWGEFVFGENGWTITDALGNAVQISHLTDEVNDDVRGMGWGEMVWGEAGGVGEGYFRDTRPTLTRSEIENLIRYWWPNGQRVMVHYFTRKNIAGPISWDSSVLDESVVPDEASGPFGG